MTKNRSNPEGTIKKGNTRVGMQRLGLCRFPLFDIYLDTGSVVSSARR